MTLRVILADDEPLARDLLEAILTEIPDVQLLAKCETGQEAVAAVKDHHPDLIFLDIEMLEMTGLEAAMTLIEEMPISDVPEIIFTTAYDQYALDAFKVSAIDYVLKPINEENIQKSLERARQILNRGRGVETALNIQRAASISQIRLQDGEKMVLVPRESLLHVRAQGDYVMLYFKDRTRLIRSTLKAVEARLPVDDFKRVHRSSIVNVKAIRELRPAPRGAATLILSNQSELPVSRSFREALQEALKT